MKPASAKSSIQHRKSLHPATYSVQLQRFGHVLCTWAERGRGLAYQKTAGRGRELLQNIFGLNKRPQGGFHFPLVFHSAPPNNSRFVSNNTNVRLRRRQQCTTRFHKKVWEEERPLLPLPFAAGASPPSPRFFHCSHSLMAALMAFSPMLSVRAYSYPTLSVDTDRQSETCGGWVGSERIVCEIIELSDFDFVYEDKSTRNVLN